MGQWTCVFHLHLTKSQTSTDNIILTVYKKTSRENAKKSLSVMTAFIHISFQFPSLLNVKANYFISVTLMAGPLPEEQLTPSQSKRLLNYGWTLQRETWRNTSKTNSCWGHLPQSKQFMFSSVEIVIGPELK